MLWLLRIVALKGTVAEWSVYSCLSFQRYFWINQQANAMKLKWILGTCENMLGKNQDVLTEIREPMKFQLQVNLWLDALTNWAMGYGDVCLSSLWASYNVNRTRLLFSHLRHDISSFYERLLMVSYWQAYGSHRTLASTLNTDQSNTLNHLHLATTLKGTSTSTKR